LVKAVAEPFVRDRRADRQAALGILWMYHQITRLPDP